MGSGLKWVGIAFAAALAGCATDPGNGLRYEDGSYYSPGSEGRGDYYVGRQYDNVRYVGDPFFDDFFWLYDGGPWYGGWYGSPFYGYGGYCSVRYRYCPRGGWADPFPRYDFQIYFGDPYYDRYYDRGYDRWPPPHRRPRPAQPRDDGRPGSDAPRPRPPQPRVQPRPSPDPSSRDERDEDPFSTPRGRRGGGIRREDPPTPRIKPTDGI